MTVTAKEGREIVAECKEEAEQTEVSPEDGGVACESTDGSSDGEVSHSTETPVVDDIVKAALDEGLSPLLDAVEAENALLESAAADIKKVLNIYDLMTESRNRSTLLLTKHIEMYERLKSLADFCREKISKDEAQSPFEKSLLSRTGNIERVALRTLCSFGVVPIWPGKNEAFDESLHQIISETDPADACDVPGAVAECLKMGVVRDGVVAKAAEVVVFRKQPEPPPEAIG